MEKRFTRYVRTDRHGIKIEAFADAADHWTRGQTCLTRADAEALIVEWNRLSTSDIRYQLVDLEWDFTPEFPGFDNVHGA